MPHEAALLDPHLVKVISLVGLLLGVLGSLFLAYDLLGSQEGPLRKFLRVALPGFIGALVYVPLNLLTDPVARLVLGAFAGASSGAPDPVVAVVTALLVGGFLGAMPALYDHPAGVPASRPGFSGRDFRGAFLLALLCVIAIYAFQFARLPYGGLPPRAYWTVEPGAALAAALAVGAAAGLWRHASGSRAFDAKPRGFTSRNAALGAGAAGAILLSPNLTGGLGITLLIPSLRTLQAAAANLVILPLVAALAVAPAGALIGGFAPRVLWWVNHTSDNRLELIGVLCILAGFAAQAVEPVVALLGP